jgi:A/G-specific adenine glycosylase
MSLQSSLLNWFSHEQRDLPWRATPVDPYHVLVSEFMLQQTQVATVVPYFHRFVQAFAAIADLAAAPEQQVLRLWQGLGYYSRARNLHATAKQIVAEHGGKIPQSAADLLKLPGIGQYTAGAIASIAFGRVEPILDGNVARVLCRLIAIRSDPRQPRTRQKLWEIARKLVPAESPGEFNSALMDLGATVCTPRKPHCGECPVRSDCKAFAAKLQNRIPPPKPARLTPLVRRWVYAISLRGRWLIEQRPRRGRWAGMWQFVTLEEADESLLPVPVSAVRPLGEIKHALTHRRYVFTVFACRASEAGPAAAGKWVTLKELARYPLPTPHVLIADMLQEC